MGLRLVGGYLVRFMLFLCTFCAFLGRDGAGKVDLVGIVDGCWHEGLPLWMIGSIVRFLVEIIGKGEREFFRGSGVGDAGTWDAWTGPTA